MTMAGQLKRKRSDSELSFSSSTTLSSPPRLMTDFGSSAPMADRVTPVPAMFRGRSAPLHLNSRTLKRFRNSRPSDAQVHEHTLNLLFTAQQSMWRQTSPCPEQNFRQMEQSGQDEQDGQDCQDGHDGQHAPPTSPGQHSLGLDCAGTNQPSLHSFWNRAQPASRQHPRSVVAAGGYAPAAGTGPVSRAPGGPTVCDEEDLVMAYAS